MLQNYFARSLLSKFEDAQHHTAHAGYQEKQYAKATYKAWYTTAQHNPKCSVLARDLKIEKKLFGNITEDNISKGPS